MFSIVLGSSVFDGWQAWSASSLGVEAVGPNIATDWTQSEHVKKEPSMGSLGSYWLHVPHVTPSVPHSSVCVPLAKTVNLR